MSVGTTTNFRQPPVTVHTPKYRQIVDQIVSEMARGTYNIGDLLPPEHRMMSAYGVSRHTVRQATQALKQMGVIEPRQGVGSVVVSKPGGTSFIERVPSVEAIVDMGAEIDRRLIGKKLVSAGEDLATAFGCDPDREFLEMKFLRHVVGETTVPTVFLTVWLDPLFGAISDLLESEGGTTRDAIVEIMKREFAFEVSAIRQNVSAWALDAEAAAVLKRAEGECALKIERRYYQKSSTQPHLRTMSICRGDLLTIESYFQAN